MDTWNKDRLKPKLTRSKDLFHLTRSHIEIAPVVSMPVPFPFLEDFVMSILPTELVLVGAKSGVGKCLGYGTPVLMFDGSIKPVQDIVNGDLVMGPDATSRTVSGVMQGHGPLYRITPVKGEPWVCNGDHILSLKRVGTDEIVNISVNDWFKLHKTDKVKLKQWRSDCDFPEKDLPIDPYVVGVWLGDGSRYDAKITIGNHKQAIKDYLQGWADSTGLLTASTPGRGCEDIAFRMPKETRGRNQNPFVWIRYNFVKNGLKYIRQDYLTGSREQRIELLSGLLDTDGSLARTGYEFTSKSRELSEGVCFLARSLGLAAYLKECRKGIKSTGFVGTYYRVGISGDCTFLKCLVNKAPQRKQRKSVLRTGFSVEPLGDGDYYGFALDKDKLFLLGDFTVTHNTEFLTQMALLWGKTKRVGFIALEAEPEEIEQRILYKLYAAEVLSDSQRDRSVHLDYRRYRLGMMNKELEKYDSIVQEKFEAQTANLFTYYMQKSSFSIIDLVDLMDDVSLNCDVCIIDHLHYFDMLGSRNDMEGMRDLMRRIREINLASKIPFVCAAHLRKDNISIMPGLDDFMGSSDIAKIATTAIMIAPKPDGYNAKTNCSTTLMSVPKLRGGGGTKIIAELEYSLTYQKYLPIYTLSTVSQKGDKVYAIERDSYPKWAKSPEDHFTYDF